MEKSALYAMVRRTVVPLTHAGPSSFRRAILSGKDQKAQTPLCMLDVIVDMYYPSGSTVFDPCPENHQEDGLIIPWKRHNFVNPSFNMIPLWVEKAAAEFCNNRAHSVLLLPLRSSTVYMHTLVLNNATSVLFWMNPVAFRPHRSPLAVPVMTVEIGLSRLRLLPGLKMYPVVLHSLLMRGQGNLYNKILVPYLRTHYGPFNTESHCHAHSRTGPEMWNLKGGSAHLLCVLARPKLCMEYITAFLNEHSNTTVVVLIMPIFNSSYFKHSVHYVKEVVLTAPYLDFEYGGTKASYVATVGLVMTNKMSYKPRMSDKTAPTAFAQWSDGSIFRD